MRLSVTVIAADVPLANDFIQLDVPAEMSLDDVKGIVEAEINIPPSAQTYIHNNQFISDGSKSLSDLGINDEDIISLAIQTKPKSIAKRSQGESSRQPAKRQQPDQINQGEPSSEEIRLKALEDEDFRRKLQNSAPEVDEVLHDPQQFNERYQKRMRKYAEDIAERQRLYDLVEADPFNIEAQQKIEESIRQERILENLTRAYEENPESFGQVKMLYVDVKVNGMPIKAFVDSGAQTTIMSPDAAERCNIMRLVDRRWSGIAKGVGTAKILGRVHQAEIDLGPYSIKTSFTVMEGKDVDLLLGLDMLKRHQMCIDLKENCLRIEEHRIPFLADHELPRMMDDINEREEKIEGPGGAKIGAETGTLLISEPTPSSSGSTSQQGQSSGSRINIHPIGSAGNVGSSGSRGGSATIPAQQSRSSPFGSVSPITEQAIAQVMEFVGCSKEEAIAALQQAGGNVDIAVGLLL